jgi:hypothetical protein
MEYSLVGMETMNAVFVLRKLKLQGNSLVYWMAVITLSVLTALEVGDPLMIRKQEVKIIIELALFAEETATWLFLQIKSLKVVQKKMI